MLKNLMKKDFLTVSFFILLPASIAIFANDIRSFAFYFAQGGSLEYVGPTIFVGAFLTSVLCFHLALAKLRLLISDAALELIVKSIDYVWYAFGAVFVALFAVIALQNDEYQEQAIALERGAEVSESIAGGMFSVANRSCAAFQERWHSAGQGIDDQDPVWRLCDHLVRVRSVDENTEALCSESLPILQRQSDDTRRRFLNIDIGNAVLSGFCFYVQDYVNARDRYSELAVEFSESTSSVRQTFRMFLIGAIIGALKVTKVTFEFWPKFRKHIASRKG